MKAYYWKDISWLEFFTYNDFEGADRQTTHGGVMIDDPKPIIFLKRIFESEWVELPILITPGISLDEAFQLLNSDELNPMATKENQSWIIKHGLHHTSMSVGDIVETDDGKLFVCVSEGWRQLTFC